MNTRRIRVGGRWRGEKHVVTQNDLSNPELPAKLVIGKMNKRDEDGHLLDAYAKRTTQFYVVIDRLRMRAYDRRRTQQFVHRGVRLTINRFAQREEMLTAVEALQRVKDPVDEVSGVGFKFEDVSLVKCPQCKGRGSREEHECPDFYRKPSDPVKSCHCCAQCRAICESPF